MTLARSQVPRPLAGPSANRWLGPAAFGVAFVLVVILGLAAATAAFVAERATAPRVAARAFPARLVQHRENTPFVTQSESGGWKQPSAIAVLGGRWFVLDTGNNRILEVDAAGNIVAVLDRSVDERMVLRNAMAIDSDGSYLYVANSGASEIIVLEPGGRVVSVLPLTKVEPEDLARPRPIGLAVTSNGELLVSDADNQRVLRYDRNGGLLQAIGSGTRAAGAVGFNSPGGLTLDGNGNIYVVDILNGRVVQLSQEGAYLRQLGRLGDTAGTLSRPKDVAVDRVGNVYVSDSLLASVQVFGPQGEYLGFIGRQAAGDRDSKSMFKAPAGLTIADGSLRVVDRLEGLFVFQLP